MGLFCIIVFLFEIPDITMIFLYYYSQNAFLSKNVKMKCQNVCPKKALKLDGIQFHSKDKTKSGLCTGAAPG